MTGHREPFKVPKTKDLSDVCSTQLLLGVLGPGCTRRPDHLRTEHGGSATAPHADSSKAREAAAELGALGQALRGETRTSPLAASALRPRRK